MSYIELPIEVNAAALIDEVYAEMREAFPGWEPGPVEAVLIPALVYRLITPLAQLAAQVGDEIFEQFGAEIMKIEPIAATPATITSTWTMLDTAGYTIPAGTQVAIATSGNTSVGFKTTADVVVPKGSAATEAGQVVLEAVIPGSEGNGLKTGASLIDALSFVASIALVEESSGGTDAEDPGDYLDRLTEVLRTLGPHPVVASDVAILARNVPGVARALALDNFNPEVNNAEEPATWTSEKTTTIAVVNAEGLPCTTAQKEAVEAEMASKREVNFVFFVIDATYTKIIMHYEVVPATGFTQAEAEAATQAALIAFVSPQNAGRGNQNSPSAWVNQKILRYQDLVTVVNNLQSVDHYTVLKVAEEGKTLGVADVTLKGAAPLPKPGSIVKGA